MNETKDRNGVFASDGTFDRLYSLRTQHLSAIHWTPVDIAKRAAAHLARNKGENILDIGSGVGKFCLIAAHYHPECHFSGIEQRKALSDEALITQKATGLKNITFLHGDFLTLNMDSFDHFYFFNSFGENLLHYKPIDNLIQTSADIYNEYVSAFQAILENKPAGTRLATYHCPDEDVPGCYQLINNSKSDQLSLWQKR